MTDAAVTTRRITQLWWPLALSWLLMAVELPIVTAVIARLPAEEPNLAALGTLVYPISLLMEAPIIMLLAASTALCKDQASYQKLLRFTHAAGLGLTLLHLAIAFTPLYDWIALDLVGVDASVVEPGRIGLQIMTPWTWAIGYRRFQQGVLIRFLQSRAVVVGTVVRLVAESGALIAAWLIYVNVAGPAPEAVAPGSLHAVIGIAIGTLGIAAGVVAEAIYAGWRVRPVLRTDLADTVPDPDTPPLTTGRFLRFYLPLAVTPLMTILLQSIGAAAMNRMPDKLASTATWSAVYGLVFLTRASGFAFNEVTVALIGQPGGVRALRRFAWGLAAVMVGILVVLALTPLGELWFGRVMQLPPHLTEVAVHAVGFAVLMPGYAVLQSLYQGALVHGHRTREVTEAVTIYLVSATALLALGIWLGSVCGIVYVLCTFTVAGLLQTCWLKWRSAPVCAGLEGPAARSG